MFFNQFVELYLTFDDCPLMKRIIVLLFNSEHQSNKGWLLSCPFPHRTHKSDDIMNIIYKDIQNGFCEQFIHDGIYIYQILHIITYGPEHVMLYVY